MPRIFAPCVLPGQCGPAQDFGLGTSTLMHLTTNPLRPKDLCLIEMIHLWVFPEKCKWMWWKLTYSKPTFQSIIHRYMYVTSIPYMWDIHWKWTGPVMCFASAGLCQGVLAALHSGHAAKEAWTLRFSSWHGRRFSRFPFGIPIPSMYGIFAYTYGKNQPNAGKYTIHGSYGIWIRPLIK